MGFIKAFTGALGGTFADEWKDFYKPAQGVSATAAIFPIVKEGTNAGRGENTKGYENIITNGSKIVVPENCALITMQDGAITGFIAEPGGFIWQSDDKNSQSFFGGNGLLASTIGSTWEKFKFGGIPGSEQLAFYVNLKEIPNNAFGTQTTIYWDDAFLQTQVGAMARGTYTLKIVDPMLFVKNFVPVKYLQATSEPFDFADMDNEAGTQLFNEVVSTLGQSLSIYSNGENGEPNRMSRIQSDQVGFGKAMAQAVENEYNWKSERGLEIVKTAIIAIEYDEDSKELMKEAQANDVEIRKAARMGQAYSNNMPGMMAAASGEAMKTAAGNEAGAMMGFMGMNMAQNTGANMLGAVANMQQQQQQQPAAQPAPTAAPAADDPYQKLAEAKKALDSGLITQEDFDKLKAQLLGL